VLRPVVGLAAEFGDRDALHDSKLLVIFQADSTCGRALRSALFVSDVWATSLKKGTCLERKKSLVTSDQAPHPEHGRKAVGGIVLTMRRDLLHKTTLQHSNFVYTSVGQAERKRA